MIYSYKRGTKPLVGWTKEVKFLKHIIRFKPGLNLVVGPNGSGKTALLRSLKTLFMAYDKGYTRLDGLRDLYAMRNTFTDKVKHNGMPIVCDHVFKSDRLDDWDVLSSLKSRHCQNSSSAGESGKYHNNCMLDNLDKLKPVSSLVEDFKKKANTTYNDYTDKWYNWFTSGMLDKHHNQLTSILDEPTNSFDIKSSLEFWEAYTGLGVGQAIIVTHDIYPLLVKGVNVIETEKGYAQEVLSIYNKWGK